MPGNGHPGEPFVWINGGLIDYTISRRNAFFIIAQATKKVFENILILFSENGNFGAIKSTDIP